MQSMFSSALNEKINKNIKKIQDEFKEYCKQKYESKIKELEYEIKLRDQQLRMKDMELELVRLRLQIAEK